MNYLMNLDFVDFFNLAKKAIEKREEELAWQMWLTLYPGMMVDTFEFKPFSEFYKELRNPISKRSTKDILAEVEEIRKQANGK